MGDQGMWGVYQGLGAGSASLEFEMTDLVWKAIIYPLKDPGTSAVWGHWDVAPVTSLQQRQELADPRELLGHPRVQSCASAFL